MAKAVGAHRRPTITRSRNARRRFVGGVAAVAALGLATIASTTAPASASASESVATPTAVGTKVSLSMAVSPGDPVPMRIITEKSRGELAGKGYSGQGIDVALIDSGVTPVRGLDQPGKILYGPDLSNEGGLPNLAGLDTYGHGTHLAGIIAGDDGEDVLGVASASRIVSVKVAGATGETDIAQVIAGIDWVVEHKNDNGLNIRVLNLSLGVPGVMTSQGDPLSAAVERAWHAGIVVVASAGNRGNEVGGIDSPAVSPYVIAVGAHESYDSSGAQDWIAPWSSGGNDSRRPDVVAPGRSIKSFRVPGSMLDQLYPSAVVDGTYFLGSGSSQSAAVVSGFTAALLSRDPSLTPDQIKHLFNTRAIELKNTPAYIEGNGKINPKDTARNLKDALKAPTQQFPAAIPATLAGGITAPSGASWAGGAWNGASWAGGTWNGASWAGASWAGASWAGGEWSGASWAGASWAGASWAGASWAGASWAGASWAGASWAGASWAGASWAGASWAGASWSSEVWG